MYGFPVGNWDRFKEAGFRENGDLELVNVKKLSLART
jgi:hypothetical protein